MKKLVFRNLHEPGELCAEYSVLVQDPDIPLWERDIYEFLSRWHDDNDHIMVHTSGSTGAPKPIALKKSWMQYSALTTCRFFGLDDTSTALLCLPAAYIAGKMMIVRAMVVKFDLLICEPKGDPFKEMTKSIDFAAVTPFQLQQSMDALKHNPIVKTLIVGGGEIPAALEAEIRDLPVEVFATYGMTETSSHIALKKINGKNPDHAFRVIGDTEISTDERNCLIVRNPNLFEEALTTNDLVEIIDPSRFKWLGRYDNIINSGGVKIIPEEIENTIAHLHHGKMIITSIPDAQLGQKAVLLIQGSGLSVETTTNLLSRIRSILPPYFSPKEIVFTPILPQTANGKIDRQKARDIAIGSSGIG